MLRSSLLWTVALASTAIAVPHVARRSPTPSISVTSTASCTAGDTSSTEGVQAILDSTGTNDWLDKQLETLGGEDDWVDKLWERVFPNQGTSPLSGCGTVGSNCVPDDMCGNYPNEQAYWTFYAVGLLHSKINYVHDKILWTGWLDGLSIDQISKDFSQPAPDDTWIKWLAAAMTIASGFGTAVDWSKGLRGMIGMAGGCTSP
ncbi:hypothetical protein N7474_010053 [Penicillium riverlandense]|uniref:uncharacterized protein n=1 Tax=Penicillium riverlandense TaxID=1903569 RepID=UPI0025490AA3|nr:uncharacterized protein N7474_010053 [Penicillium riverlandense]KAJ5808784.1 hypothetical protein N7474_010053 [Penicillium riverlandense]